MDTLKTLFSSEGFMPHGHCFLWSPGILWTTVISDGLIALAYLTIPFTLVYLIWRRRDIPFDWVIFAFGVFILACGSTHLADIWTVWNPDYWLTAGLKAVTAVASIVTAALLVKLIPLALAIPSPAQLAKVNADLQALNEELREAMAGAEVASRTKSAFLASMSHELRTPLNAILGYAQLMRRDQRLPTSLHNAVSTVQQSGQHLLALINDVLDISKVEAGKLELHTHAVRLSEFVAVLADIIRVRAEKKGLGFEAELANSLPEAVSLDETRLRQVLLNLLGNAVKFTERGRVKLKISQTERLNAGDEIGLRFEVVDEGVGIAPDQIGKIFEPFEQVGDVKLRAGGTGLGLAISRQLVELMGGALSVESIPGEGSRFWFDVRVLPLAASVSAQDVPQVATGYHGARKTILVVDDVAANRALLLDLLGALDFKLLEAENGEIGVRLAHEERPDLILLDLVMPVMDGVEATKRLRAESATASMPIVIVSASATPEDEASVMQAGANAFITKPIDERELLGEIGNLLKLEWSQERPGQQAHGGAKPSSSTEELVPPPAEALRELHKLALAGRLSELRRVAAQLIGLGDCYRPFVNKLDGLAADFESKAVLAMVETYIQPQTPQGTGL
jgi:signal transduction histidine kinase/DNA-binding NarL/FixJ family response regulator